MLRGQRRSLESCRSYGDNPAPLLRPQGHFSAQRAYAATIAPQAGGLRVSPSLPTGRVGGTQNISTKKEEHYIPRDTLGRGNRHT